ncbi:MAG: 2OG-Fe dioxygenase family protein [Ottowia sp.]|nr:2OG-Fe dioxygenase family protein [Ottowia sp.]
MFSPPFSSRSSHVDHLRRQGYAVLCAADVRALAAVDAQELAALQADWEHLERDAYLRDGGAYRYRRHASFIVAAGQVTPVAHRAHWQPLQYNALHGGMQRWFAPVAQQTQAAPAWQKLLCWVAAVASAAHPAPRWYGEAHQFRIDTTGGIGRPTPEGAHRDGVDVVAVLLVSRAGIKGGETRVFELDGPSGQRFTLEEPWSVLLLDDAMVIHETTPIQPLAPSRPGHRDTLVVTLRAGGFLAPGA